MRRITFLSLVCAFCVSGCTGLEAGWKAFRSGDYDAAQRHAIAALAEEPRNPEVYHLVANTALKRGQYDSALKSAEFAHALDGGTLESERLIREVCAAKRAWGCVCESGLRSLEHGFELDASDEAYFREGYAALLSRGTGEGYGCYRALGDETLEGIDGVKSAYALGLEAQGLTQEALAIEETVSDPEVSILRVSRRLFALQRSEEAAEKLRAYVALEGDSEARISAAADVCEDYRAWGLGAEILENSRVSLNKVRRAVMLRRGFRAEESDTLLKSHFASARSVSEVRKETKILLEAGYADTAAEAFLTCSECARDVDLAFELSDELARYGQFSSALQILSELGDQFEADGRVQVRLFKWYREYQYYSQALLASERAVKQGSGDFEFHVARLQNYVDSRDILGFERESKAWLSTFEAPALDARRELAKLESKRSNWGGVLSVLEPAAQAEVLKGEARTLYFDALSHVKEYAALDKALDRHGADIAPLARAKYFFTPETESLFLKSVHPLLSGSVSEKIDGELVIAEYYLRVKEDDEKAKASVERVLTVTERSSYGFERVVAFTNQFGLDEEARVYGRQWLETYSSEDKPYTVLGELYLRHKLFEEASEVYTAYVGKQSDKYWALRFVYQTYGRFNASDSGLSWLEGICAPVLASGLDADYLLALTESRLESYRGMRSKDAEMAALLRLEVIRGFEQLLAVRPEKALSFAADLGSIEAYESASKAYDRAATQEIEWRIDQRIHRVKMALRAGRDRDHIQSIVKFADGNSEATFKLASMLEVEQGLSYGIAVLETQLSAEKADDREKAYSYLSAWALANGDFSRVRQYSARVEETSVNHADIRLKCAKSAMDMHDWDEAVRHLTWLQATRPDARDVLEAQLELARRAPDHVGAQKLFTTTLEGAEGVYHRLEWLSESFEQYGDKVRALHYAEKAYDVLTVDRPSLKLRLIGLYLHSGALEDERRDRVDTLVSSLRGTSVWNATQLVKLSEQANEAGYYDQAQLWMEEAIDKSPDSRVLRQQRLEMALDSESLGLMALSLEAAAAPPAADVLGLLESRGAMQEAFHALDTYAQNGEYVLALSGLLRLLPEYVQGRGVVATRRALEDYVDMASEYRSEVSAHLVNHALMGARPCDAMAWISDVSDGAVWAHVMMRCEEASSVLTNHLRSKRAAMSYRVRAGFDQQVYAGFVRQGAGERARQYAEDMGIELTSFEHFERMMYSGMTLEALRHLEQTPVLASEILEVMRILSGFGYHAETVAYAQSHIGELSSEDAVRAASMAVLLGGSAEAFSSYLPGEAAQYVDYAPSDVVKLIAVGHIESWLQSTPTYRLGSVLEVALACAAADGSSRDAILAAIDQALLKHDRLNSLLITYGQHAMDMGLYDVAASVYGRLVQSMPSSDYAHRMYSVALARLNRLDEAWLELAEGARCADMVLDYWQRSAELHVDSPVSLRLKINGEHRALAPRSADLYVKAAGYAIESGDIANAQLWSRQAYEYGRYSVLEDLAQVWIASNALSEIPAEILSASTSMTLGIEARQAYQNGDKDLAIRRFEESASRAPWPLKVWIQNATFFKEAGDMPKYEQTIAQMMKAYPHAYEPYIQRAIYALMHQRVEDAWSDYQLARALAFEAGDWHLPLVAAAASQFEVDFVKRIYAQDQSLGILKAEKWLETLVNVYANERLAVQNQHTAKDWAQKGLKLIHQILPKPLIFAKTNADLHARYVALEQSAR